MKNSVNILDRYRDIYSTMNREWSMWWDATHLQYAVVTALNSDLSPEVLSDSIFRTAEEIKEKSGWFGELNSSIRFIIAALLVQKGDSATAYMDELSRARDLFRQHKIRRGGMYEIVAITILRLCGTDKDGVRPISADSIDRFRSLHAEMAKYQWWLTSIDDYPSCAILATQKRSVEELGAQSEAIYQALRDNGYWRGNPLQDAANMLNLVEDHPASIASRFHEIAEVFRNRKVRIWQSEYDEVAVLSLAQQSAEKLVDRTLEIQEELRTLKPRVPKYTAFNLACSLAFMESVKGLEASTMTTAKAMIDLNAIIAAQQAAVIAACTAGAVAASTAASSS